MDTFIKNTPPVWIFGLTLLAIIATGPLVGTSPCERAIKDCYTLGSGASPDGTLPQQASAAQCEQVPCEVKKRGAFVPLAILIAGLVIMNVWFRQRAPSSPGGKSANAPVPSQARSGTRGTSASGATPAARKSPPSKAAAGSGSLPKTRRESTAEEPREESTAARSASVEAPALGEEQRSFCLEVLHGNIDQSKDALTASLGRLLGAMSADQWKGARLADLDLLTKALAAGALFGSLDARYRRGLRGVSDAALLPGDELQQQTKKSLASHCLTTLRADLHAIVDDASHLAAPGHAAVPEIVTALDDKGALSGLAKCGKEGLLRLAVVIA